jgi:hypothetical protein
MMNSISPLLFCLYRLTKTALFVDHYFFIQLFPSHPYLSTQQ